MEARTAFEERPRVAYSSQSEQSIVAPSSGRLLTSLDQRASPHLGLTHHERPLQKERVSPPPECRTVYPVPASYHTRPPSKTSPGSHTLY